MSETMLKPHTTMWLVLQLRKSRFVLLVLWTCLILISLAACQMSNITTNSNITLSTNMTMVSPGGVFAVGFTNGTQSTNSSTVYALAIWYAQIKPQTVVWIANRSMALSSKATLTITPQGDLQVFDHVGNHAQPVWTSNTAHLNVTMACIRDDGNLVIVNDTKCTNNKSTLLWQSFTSYSDTILPGQSYHVPRGYNARSIFSWQNEGDWRKGNYSLQWLTANAVNLTLSAIWKNPISSDIGYQEYWRQDHSHHLFFVASGLFESRGAPTEPHRILCPKLEPQKSRLLRVTLDQDGNLRMYSWIVGSSTKWKIVWTLMPDCNVVGYCGPNVLCSNGTYACITKNFEFIDSSNFRLGCKRIESKSYDFMAPLGVVDYVFTDLDVYNRIERIPLNKCLQLCLSSNTCQMVVTTTTNSTPELVDSCWLKRSASLNGQNLPLRLAYIRVNTSTNPSRIQQISLSRIKQIVLSVLGAAVVILCVVGWRWFLYSHTMTKQRLQEKWREAKGTLVKFSYKEVVLMTENYANKIGEGGYGTVYKGHVGKTTIAVKQLKKELSSHVEKEFMQEVENIGTIHHVHLVSLLGYCAKGSNRLLVYEFVGGGTLDKALFQREMRPVLDWRTRFRVAIQTARGLAYLHDDCKRRIIHCDVKPENILLDEAECVKVADFGLSRIMNRDQTGTMTKNIRGTYGYIAPEWTAIDGTAITTKVDVYSYGMVLLEIISGRRNWVSTNDNFDAPDVYFPAWAFPKLEADTIMDVVDKALTRVVDMEELRRTLQVAFWCINEQPRLRPTMNEVVLMLEGLTPILLPVQKPAYLDHITSSRSHDSSVLSSSLTSSFVDGVDLVNHVTSPFPLDSRILSSNLASSSIDIVHPVDPTIQPFLSGECFILSSGR